VRLLAPRPRAAAQPLFALACDEAARISFAVGVEHLVLACAAYGALDGFDVRLEDVRERIVAEERDALASLGISLDSVRGELEDTLDDACLPVSPAAKRMLALASRRRRSVSAEQLLATLAEHSIPARRLLRELGVDPALVRR
jgi:hypothetical protein